MPNDLPAAAAIGSGKLPPGLAVALVPLLVLIVALDVYCLIDLTRARSVRNVPKWVWAIVILFVSAPIGALVYLFAGRDRGRDSAGEPAPALVTAGAGGGVPGPVWKQARTRMPVLAWLWAAPGMPRPAWTPAPEQARERAGRPTGSRAVRCRPAAGRS